METPALQFPKNFFWGASTSSHQVEGGNHNDWSEWEIAHAEELANTAASKFSHWLPYWQEIQDQAQDPANYISGKAADHYNLYEKDFDILKDLNMNAYRFSIEWSRVEPQYGSFDWKVVEHYHDMIKSLRDRGIEPFVTLWHWTIPTWFRDRGAWLNVDAPRYFSDYVNKIVSTFPEVKYWITLNEPEVYARQSFLAGDWPPQERSFGKYFMVVNNLASAHNYISYAMKQIRPAAAIGIAHNAVYLEPLPANFINKGAAWLINWWMNRYLLNRISKNMDFIGINYYFRSRVNFTPYLSQPTQSRAQSDLGWQLYPEGIYHVLKDAKRYRKPIFITEHGLADARDQQREWYVTESLKYMQKAIQEGVDLRGYFHWSLLDNFEWDKGFWPRFGLVEVDFKTLERKVRPSAKKLAELIKSVSSN